MSLQIIGLSHKTAPLEIRERLAFGEQDYISNLRNLTDGKLIREALLLSTCNRVEILVEADSARALKRIIEFISGCKNVAPEVFEHQLYHFSDERAVNHLFRVAASLDSLIVGEDQILKQVRKAYELAAEAGTVRRKIHKLLHHTFRTAKRVRSGRRSNKPAISVSCAAVEKAKKIFGSLSDKSILMIGAGEMAELAAKQLFNKGAKRILICNRTLENADRLAREVGGEVVEFEKLKNALPEVDVVICSTAAPGFIISAEMTRQSQSARRNRSALFIDISVPRTVAPEIAEIDNVFLYDVDDLQSVVAVNAELLRQEIINSEQIIKEEAAAFWKFLPILEKDETIGLLQRKMHESAQREFEKHRSKLAGISPEQENIIRQILNETVNKIAQPVIYSLRRAHETGAGEFAEILCTVIGETNEINSQSS